MRAGLPKPGNARHHQSGIDRAKRLPTQPHAIEHTRPVVLDQRVSRCDEIKQGLSIICLLQIEIDAELGPGSHAPPDRHILDTDTHQPGWITTTGLLYLDDLSTELCHQAARKRSGERKPKLHHSQALEGPTRAHARPARGTPKRSASRSTSCARGSIA